MALLDIEILGSKVLREEAAPVEAVTDEIRRLVRDMFDTMYQAEGIGLAGPQVGVSQRVLVVDVTNEDESRHVHALVNPVIVESSKATDKAVEGCLSIPGIEEKVIRPVRVTVEALSPDGEPVRIETDGLLARALQHEELTVYGTRSEGYRLGGTNNPGIINNPASAQAGVPPLFEADKVTSYEIGVKSQWMGGAVQWNNSAFFMTWENLQVAGQDPTGAFGFIGNAGEAEVNGVETEVIGRFGNLDLTAALTFLGKRELTEDQVSESVVAPGKAGDEIPEIPEMTASFMAQYNFQPPIAGWDAFVRVEGNHKGSS